MTQIQNQLILQNLTLIGYIMYIQIADCILLFSVFIYHLNKTRNMDIKLFPSFICHPKKSQALQRLPA